MASAFSLDQVTLFYSEKELLTKVSLTVTEGDRIGVVGRNGAGKSTLLRLLAGLEEPSSGGLSTKKGARIAYLPQTPQMNPEDTITEAALSYLPFGKGTEQEAAAFEAQSILTQLGFADMHRKTGELSEGQRMRVAMAGVLCKESDILLMDEPTNHIDIMMTQWLEERLRAYKGTLLVVTHDRRLLESNFTRIFHVGEGKVDCYQCGYTGYLEERAQREEMEQATLRKNRSLYRKELAWIRRGAQARSTKAKGRIDRFETLTDAIQEKPLAESIAMKSVSSRLGKKTVSWDNLSVQIEGQTLIRDFSYNLLRDDRVGIIGGNGAGKTTLLRTLLGEIPPSSGKIDVGDTVKIGYFSQLCPPLNEETRIIDAVRDVAVHVYTPDGDLSASQMAELFLFPGAMQYQKVSSLSGGERRRLHLLRVLMTAPNVLFLDEPTNDLDIETLNVLEDYLDTFQGAVVTVSHDRYFLDRVTNHLFSIEDERMVPYIGGYESFLAAQKQKATLCNSPKEEKRATETRQRANLSVKFTFNEQRDFDSIEQTIADLESQLESIAQQIADNASNYQQVTQLMAQQQDTQTQLDHAMERWMYLQEKYEQMNAK